MKSTALVETVETPLFNKLTAIPPAHSNEIFVAPPIYIEYDRHSG